MKRSIDETDAPNANDARQKLKDSLIPFDQSREASEALLLQCCYSILERQPSRSLNVRGLVHELNRTVAPGAFTKRGEERTASTYVKQVLGGCRAWCEALPADVFEVVGSWSTNVELRLVSRDDADMTDDDAFVDGCVEIKFQAPHVVPVLRLLDSLEVPRDRRGVVPIELRLLDGVELTPKII